MDARPQMMVTAVVLDSADANELAGFYQRLLGWSVIQEKRGWVRLSAPAGGAGLSFQTESDYVRPVWPASPGDPQMGAHLDIQVADLEEAGSHAEKAGAVLAEFQPQEDVRVFLDPAGHPFCLYL
ncbi:VOC family protein [Actinoplanes sp. NPDC049265]|uniref:VOC family protein n=1 Tax=Actinoplanes sp. NPDC049265 TaxID=3363902 RepID=UPI00371590F8